MRMKNENCCNQDNGIKRGENKREQLVVHRSHKVEHGALGLKHIQSCLQCGSSARRVGKYVWSVKRHNGESTIRLKVRSSLGKPVAFFSVIEASIRILCTKEGRTVLRNSINEFVHGLNSYRIVLKWVFLLHYNMR